MLKDKDIVQNKKNSTTIEEPNYEKLTEEALASIDDPESGEEKNKEAKTPFYKFLDRCVDVMAALLSIFSLTYAFGGYDIITGYSRHLLMALFICLIVKGIVDVDKRSPWRIALYLPLAIAACAACIYLDSNSLSLSRERLGMYNTYDYIAGAVIIIACIVATYKQYGITLTAVVTFFVVYLFIGRDLPSIMRHPGLSIERVIAILGLYQEGIMGSALGAIVQTVGAVLVFAAFLEVSGASKIFMDLTISAFGNYTGGAAKIAVVSSSLFGTISGSAAANVAGTGVITIPLMKKTGFEAHYAGAVEATASSGGQIMPPVMGAAAFIMAEMLGVPYRTVLFAAIIPALLYYTATFMSIHLYACRMHIHGIGNAMQLPPARQILLHGGYLLIPILMLFGLVAVFNFSAQFSALFSTVAIVILSWFNKEYRLTPQKIWKALILGGRQIVPISIICAAAGIVVGIFNATGLGIKLSSYIISVAGDSLMLLCILAAISSLILGMGMPTVACYLLLVALVVPAMVDFGVLPIAAHMFVFYFGIISAITPPVAIAAYVASGICKANPMKVGFTACWIALPVFLIPFVFVYEPAMLMQGSAPWIIQVCITSLLGCFGCAVATQGYAFDNLAVWERIACMAAALMMLIPEPITDVIGICTLLAIVALSFIRSKRRKAAAQS